MRDWICERLDLWSCGERIASAMAGTGSVGSSFCVAGVALWACGLVVGLLSAMAGLRQVMLENSYGKPAFSIGKSTN